MSLRNRTFGEKIPLVIEKMSGLEIRKDGRVFHIQGWDELGFSGKVDAVLFSGGEQVIWKGSLLENDEITEFFQPESPEQEGSPRTYATRSGRLGRPKTVGVIRLETLDGIKFALTLCNGGEQPVKKLVESELIPESLSLELTLGERSLLLPIFQDTVHGNKLAKLRNLH